MNLWMARASHIPMFVNFLGPLYGNTLEQVRGMSANLMRHTSYGFNRNHEAIKRGQQSFEALKTMLQRQTLPTLYRTPTRSVMEAMAEQAPYQRQFSAVQDAPRTDVTPIAPKSQKFIKDMLGKSPMRSLVALTKFKMGDVVNKRNALSLIASSNPLQGISDRIVRTVKTLRKHNADETNRMLSIGLRKVMNMAVATSFIRATTESLLMALARTDNPENPSWAELALNVAVPLYVTSRFVKYTSTKQKHTTPNLQNRCHQWVKERMGPVASIMKKAKGLIEDITPSNTVSIL